MNVSLCDLKRVYDINTIKGDKASKNFTKSIRNFKKLLNTQLHTLPKTEPIGETELKKRREEVSGAFMKAWKAYEATAWGHDELMPVANKSHDWLGMGITIVDSIDTMYMMGLTEEYTKARNWIANDLDFSANNNTALSVFEATIRVLGGLVSIYEFTKDKVFLEKAEELGKKLVKTFDSPSGIPYKFLDMTSDSAYSATCGATSLAATGSLQMEFASLSKFTGDPSYAEKALKVFDLIAKAPKYKGLHPLWIDPEQGTFQNSRFWWDYYRKEMKVLKPFISIGSGADSFYEYMLKIWILGGKREHKYKKMFNKALDPVIAQLMFFSEPSGLLYVADTWGNTVIKQMHHLACFAGGMFALASYHNASNDVDLHMKIAKELTYTCHEFWDTQTGLAPTEVSFYELYDFMPMKNVYTLHPETIETYYILYWITGDPIYQEWGWEAFNAIQQYCSIPNGGYAGVMDVTDIDSEHDDMQNSFFLAETLKYLYLLFSPRDAFSLDDWVFNTEAHPFRVWKT